MVEREGSDERLGHRCTDAYLVCWRWCATRPARPSLKCAAKLAPGIPSALRSGGADESPQYRSRASTAVESRGECEHIVVPVAVNVGDDNSLAGRKHHASQRSERRVLGCRARQVESAVRTSSIHGMEDDTAEDCDRLTFGQVAKRQRKRCVWRNNANLCGGAAERISAHSNTAELWRARTAVVGIVEGCERTRGLDTIGSLTAAARYKQVEVTIAVSVKEGRPRMSGRREISGCAQRRDRVGDDAVKDLRPAVVCEGTGSGLCSLPSPPGEGTR